MRPLPEAKKFESAKAAWLREENGFLSDFWDFLSYAYYSSSWFSINWWSVPHRLVQLAMVASGPAIAFHTAKITKLWEAVSIFAVLLLVMVILAGVAEVPRRRESRISKPVQDMWIRFGNLLTTVKSGATPVADRTRSIEFTLALSTSLAAQVTGISQNKFSASLLLYNDEKTQMTVEHRDRGSDRPIGRAVSDLSTLLGHHACEAGGAPRVVADMKRFGSLGRKSPTQSNANYRSILLHPVVSSQKEEITGFISVDCLVPHAFHGRRAENLVALLEPLKSHIEDII